MVFELADKGSLADLLHQQGSQLTVQDLMNMIIQVLSGMRYLEGHNVIHRDVAARNVLVAEGNKMKIADLGLSRVAEDYYTSDKSVPLPIRWCPPEVIQYRKFSHSSDVSSFGVLLWEIFSKGKIPFYNLTNAEVSEEVLKGGRLSAPVGCPDNIFEIARNCWKEDPLARPTFQQIYDQLLKIIPTESVSNFKPAEPIKYYESTIPNNYSSTQENPYHN